MVRLPWRRKRPAESEQGNADASSFDLSSTVTQRQFLRMLAAAVGVAGLGLATPDPPRAAANYNTGPPDWIDTSLNVQGNLTVGGKMGIGRPVPDEGRLDVAGAIYVNGAVAIDSSGVALQSYYAAVDPLPATFDPGEWGIVRQYKWGDLTANGWMWAYLQTLAAP